MRSLYEFGRFVLDPEEHRLTLDGTPVSITPKAFDILVVLVRKAPRLVTKEQLLQEVWRDSYVEEANLAVHISALRRMLSEHPDQDRYIETVPRRGYRFVAPVHPVEVPDASVAELSHEGVTAGEAPPVPHTPHPPVPAVVATPHANVERVSVPLAAPPPPIEVRRTTARDAVQPAHHRRWPLIAGLGSLVGVALLAAILSFSSFSTSSARRGDLAWERIATEGRLTRLSGSESSYAEPTISADGRLLAFVLTDEKDQTDLYVRQVVGGDQLRLTNDAAVEQFPRFSPDGDRLLFSRLEPKSLAPEIRVVSTLGGASRVVTKGVHGTWSPKGDRLAYVGWVQPEGPQGLYTSLLDGTEVREILSPAASHPFLRRPAWSRDGRIAVVRGTGGVAGEIWVVPATGGEAHRFTQAGAEVWSDWPSFTPDGGGLLYASNRGGAVNLWVQMFEGNRAVRLTTGPGPENSPTISDDGIISFLSSPRRDELLLHTLASGSTRSLFAHGPYIWSPVFSPVAKETTFSRSEVDGSWHLWTMPLEGNQTPRQLTFGALGELYPRYMPDGKSVIYHSWGTPRHVWRVALQGGTPVQLTFGDHEDGYADPSPDGQLIAFARTDGMERVHVASLAGGDARPLTARPSTVPRWSPDGSLIAFSPSRAFNGGIFVIGADGTDERRLTEVGGWPVWWPDGKRIAYIAIGPTGAQQIWSVPVAGGPARLLETLTYASSNYPFDISRDAQRIVTSNSVRVAREIWLLQAPGRQ
jgi:Tol biopolymer transport system component/DNA-binding winged helix-turn-helix (wHTH) protein